MLSPESEAVALIKCTALRLCSRAIIALVTLCTRSYISTYVIEDHCCPWSPSIYDRTTRYERSQGSSMWN